MESKFVMLIVSVPVEHADVLRKVMAEAGAGKMGNYSHCSFSYSGTGRFWPSEGSNPAFGTKGELNAIPEERIEMLCERAVVQDVIAAMKEAHPYEEPAYHYIPVEI
ncbi:MAG: hypothetical protein WA021_03600 [Minisyncoccia bacterium]